MRTKASRKRTASPRGRRQLAVPPKGNYPGEAIALLRSWCEGDGWDPEEQRESLEALMNGLDEHRLPGSKLFE